MSMARASGVGVILGRNLRMSKVSTERREARVRVALAELDSGMGYLSYLVQEANRAQAYYYFDLVYLPIPSGTLRTDGDQDTGLPRLFLPRIDDFLRLLPRELRVDLVCILTRSMIGGFTKDGSLFGDYFAAALTNEPRVFAISTYQMRDYASQAGVPFLKAVLFLCVGMILVANTPLAFHNEVAGCPLDSCLSSRDEIIEGLRHMKFDHQPCRDQIKDTDGGKMVQAIDTLLALPLSDSPAGGDPPHPPGR